MLNFKHLAVIAAVSASALLGGCFTPTPQNTVYRFSEGVSFESIDGVLVSLDEAEVVIHKNEDFKLIITSGGGRIDAFNLLLDRLIRTNLHITTKVHTYAASAAAMMFILGDERIMNEDAVLIFHKSRIIVQGTHITANDMLLFLKGAHPSKTITDILSKVDRKLVLDTFKDLSKIDITMFKLLEKKFGKETALKLLTNKDVFIYSKEAIKLKIATKIYKLKKL